MKNVVNVEKNHKKEQIALFRYGIISPLVTNTYHQCSKEEFYRDAASKKYYLFDKELILQPATIKNWFIKYQKDGFKSLYPKTRSDINTSRILTKEVINRIKELKNNLPHISGTLIYQKLVEEGFINFNSVSKSTILRFIRDNDLKRTQHTNTDRRAFEMETANDMWQSDTSSGPYLTINGKKGKTYLILIIDDASRLITGYEFFFNDNALNLQKVLKKAVKKYGVPKRLFVDNGSTYKNEQLSLINANIGCVLIHTKINSPQSKGKVERAFGTVKNSWLNGIDWNTIKSLEELNELLKDFVNKYNNSIHSSLNDTPNNRWIKDFSKIRKLDNEKIDEYFLHTKYTTIRSDAIAKISKREYEVEAKYIGEKIKVKYSPEDVSEIYIYEEFERVGSAKLVNKVENSKIKRKENIYTKYEGGKENV